MKQILKNILSLKVITKLSIDDVFIKQNIKG